MINPGDIPNDLNDLTEYPALFGRSLRFKSQEEILKTLGIKHYPQDIKKMSKAELIQEFGRGPKSKRLNQSLFIKNIAWQTYERILNGEKPFDVGNIRSFWYYIKDTMERAGAIGEKGDPYNIVSDMFVIMVKAGLFKYGDFGFEDDDRGNRWFGKRYPQIILFAEKTSYTDLLQEINRDYDLTTIATGGQSSYLSCEYFVTEMKTAGVDLEKEFFVFSIVDFDPSGDIIATRFVENLKDNGIKNFRRFPGPFHQDFYRKDLVTPADMTPAQKRRVFRLPLKMVKSGQAARWAEKTGGVNGKKGALWGIETIVIPKAQIQNLFDENLSKVVTIDLAKVAIRREMRTLKSRLKELALRKLQNQSMGFPGSKPSSQNQSIW